jgi:halogenation protein CepH
MAKAAKIQAQGIAKTFSTETGGLEAIADVSLDIADGEFVALVGPSGCGKSTLLNILAGFDRPDRGEVAFAGEPVTGPTRRGVLITQRGSVFPWLRVRENLRFAARGLPEAEVGERIARYIEMVGLRGFEDAWPHQLSGGMLQRVEFARALMAKPDVLFMDEPFGALDALTRLRMRGELLEILARDRHTCLLVTHDVEEALHLADRVVVFSPRPARIQAVIEVTAQQPRLMSHPAMVALRERVLHELGLSALDLLRESSAPRPDAGEVSRAPEDPVAPPGLSLRPAVAVGRGGPEAQESFDVVVLGGGPAGASAATLLARGGLKTLVLEREHFPRYRVGESLLPAAWDLFERLGVTAEVEAEGFTVKHGVAFRLPGMGQTLECHTSEYQEYFHRPYTFHVERDRFDEILLHHARDQGADVREGWTAKDVLFKGDTAAGVLAGPNGAEPRPILSRVVVDATGRNCLLSRKLGWRRPDPLLNTLAHFTQFEGGSRPPLGFAPRAPDAMPNSVATHFFGVPGGWVWYIPLRNDRVSVGAVVQARYDAGIRGDPQARFNHFIQACPEVSGWLAGARRVMDVETLSSISYLNDCFVGNGFVLVGDASMFLDPVFAAGVTMAMRSGIFAAETILEAFEANDLSAARLEPYEARIRLPMTRILKLVYHWYQLLDHPTTDHLFARACTTPADRERLIVLFSGGYERIDFESLLGVGAET